MENDHVDAFYFCWRFFTRVGVTKLDPDLRAKNSTCGEADVARGHERPIGVGVVGGRDRHGGLYRDGFHVRYWRGNRLDFRRRSFCGGRGHCGRYAL